MKEVMHEKWSAPLQQLMNEHVSLKKDMEDFYEIIEEIEIEIETGPVVIHLFTVLSQRISAFTKKLEAHSELEEKGLFPLMTQHLGENDRTIEEMEWEHEKAERHLQDFLSEADKIENIVENEVQWITTYAFQAHATLTQHFAKEEKVLFPLAESVLSLAEKEVLEQLLRIE